MLTNEQASAFCQKAESFKTRFVKGFIAGIRGDWNNLCDSYNENVNQLRLLIENNQDNNNYDHLQALSEAVNRIINSVEEFIRAHYRTHVQDIYFTLSQDYVSYLKINLRHQEAMVTEATVIQRNLEQARREVTELTNSLNTLRNLNDVLVYMLADVLRVAGNETIINLQERLTMIVKHVDEKFPEQEELNINQPLQAQQNRQINAPALAAFNRERAALARQNDVPNSSTTNPNEISDSKAGPKQPKR
ncbi:MAG: hypothetical protein JSS53_01780 [Proteobacteria bacterium]|nr:hypothetical protein [Pseudomonadota bacterium]